MWRSYELGPDLSREPGPTAADQMRGGDWWDDRAEARLALVRELGAAEGVQLNLEKARPVSSFDAHRLVHLGAGRREADDVLEGLLRAYHTEGWNIADPDVLRAVGVAAGRAGDDVDRVLSGDAYAAAVRADERRAVELAVTGVPRIVVEGAAAS